MHPAQPTGNLNFQFGKKNGGCFYQKGIPRRSLTTGGCAKVSRSKDKRLPFHSLTLKFCRLLWQKYWSLLLLITKYAPDIILLRYEYSKSRFERSSQQKNHHTTVPSRGDNHRPPGGLYIDPFAIKVSIPPLVLLAYVSWECWTREETRMIQIRKAQENHTAYLDHARNDQLAIEGLKAFLPSISS